MNINIFFIDLRFTLERDEPGMVGLSICTFPRTVLTFTLARVSFLYVRPSASDPSKRKRRNELRNSHDRLPRILSSLRVDTLRGKKQKGKIVYGRVHFLQLVRFIRRTVAIGNELSCAACFPGISTTWTVRGFLEFSSDIDGIFFTIISMECLWLNDTENSSALFTIWTLIFIFKNEKFYVGSWCDTKVTLQIVLNISYTI